MRSTFKNQRHLWCATVFFAAYSLGAMGQVQIGDTREVVTQQLGNPAAEVQDGDISRLFYTPDVRIDIRSNAVVHINGNPQAKTLASPSEDVSRNRFTFNESEDENAPSPKLQLTKEQWKQKLQKRFTHGNADGEANSVGVIENITLANFRTTMGEPERTTTTGTAWYRKIRWYYECKDGTIEVEFDADYFNTYKRMWGIINDY